MHAASDGSADERSEDEEPDLLQCRAAEDEGRAEAAGGGVPACENERE
jgi:hypothetical protein